MIYELREYFSADDKVDRLDERFETDTVRIFERHGIEVVGAWRPQDDPTRLLYITRFPDEEARNKAWAAFKADDEWQAVKARTEQDGPLLRHQASTVLLPTSYSPLR